MREKTDGGAERPDDGTTLLKVPQVAARLGVSVRKVWRLLSQGVLPAVKVGARGTRVPDTALDDYITSLSGAR